MTRSGQRLTHSENSQTFDTPVQGWGLPLPRTLGSVTPWPREFDQRMSLFLGPDFKSLAVSTSCPGSFALGTWPAGWEEAQAPPRGTHGENPRAGTRRPAVCEVHSLAPAGAAWAERSFPGQAQAQLQTCEQNE